MALSEEQTKTLERKVRERAKEIVGLRNTVDALNREPLDADGAVARERAGAGEDEVSDTGEAGEGLGFGSAGGGEVGPLAVSAGGGGASVARRPSASPVDGGWGTGSFLSSPSDGEPTRGAQPPAWMSETRRLTATVAAVPRIFTALLNCIRPVLGRPGAFLYSPRRPSIPAC